MCPSMKGVLFGKVLATVALPVFASKSATLKSRLPGLPSLADVDVVVRGRAVAAHVPAVLLLRGRQAAGAVRREVQRQAVGGDGGPPVVVFAVDRGADVDDPPLAVAGNGGQRRQKAGAGQDGGAAQQLAEMGTGAEWIQGRCLRSAMRRGRA